MHTYIYIYMRVCVCLSLCRSYDYACFIYAFTHLLFLGWVIGLVMGVHIYNVRCIHMHRYPSSARTLSNHVKTLLATGVTSPLMAYLLVRSQRSPRSPSCTTGDWRSDEI